MLLHELVSTSRAVAAASGRLHKIDRLATLLRRLTPDEVDIAIAFLSGAVGLIRHHHEWFDGSGYPDALRGEEIPLAARVFAVADSFDAMTSDRPYRRAMGIERALAEIRAGAGTQWDPDVARVFVQMIEEDPPTDDEAFARALGQAG